MKTYAEKLEIAECIIKEAKSYYMNSEYAQSDMNMRGFYEDIEQLKLKQEDEDLYRIRLDMILVYTDQY